MWRENLADRGSVPSIVLTSDLHVGGDLPHTAAPDTLLGQSFIRIKTETVSG